MRIFIIALLLLWLFNIGYSQNWAQNQAIWHYEQTDYGPPFYDDYIKLTYVGDTVINGDSSTIIFEEKIFLDTIFSGYIYMKSNSNRVYLFVPSLNTFELVYDFNAITGDTIEVFCRQGVNDSLITIKIDSVSTIDINGHNLKVQYVSQPILEECYMAGTIIEKIGWIGFMFPLSSLTDPPYGGSLRCYEDSVIGQYKVSSYNCDYIVSVNSIKANKNLKIFPNPTTGKIRVQAEGIVGVEVMDITGKPIIKHSRENGNPVNNEIDLSQHPKGIYIIKVRTAKGVVVEKVVLE